LSKEGEIEIECLQLKITLAKEFDDEILQSKLSLK
jgi:hypothetical protein